MNRRYPPARRGDDGLQIEVRTSTLEEAFIKLWVELFTTPVHLDSALSKQPRHLKSLLAQLIVPILLRPASLAQAMGVGVSPGEPWSLTREQLAHWRPAWLIAKALHQTMQGQAQKVAPVQDDFPPHFLAELGDAWAEMAKEPPLSLRVSRGHSPQNILQEFRKAGLPVRAELSDLSPQGIRLAGYTPIMGKIGEHDYYEEGAFEIQDEGSQVMAYFALWPELFSKLLRSSPGELRNLPGWSVPELPRGEPFTVVDACAGAGGKSLALADALVGRGRVYAYDLNERKLQALRRRATRAGLNNIQAVALPEGQESEALAKFRGSAEVVLVDAPCSGWGVLRRSPDIKWRQGLDTLEKMSAIQSRLLSVYSELVAPGGRLVFGVCTFRKGETTEVVDRFLASHPEFSRGPGGYVGPGPCDGFFMQSMTKKGAPQRGGQ